MENNYMTGYMNNGAPYPMQQNQGPNYGNQNSNFPSSNCDFVNVPGPEKVKEFLVRPGQKIYFLDNNDPIMYTKEANTFGTTETKAFVVNEVDFNQLLNRAVGNSGDQGVTKSEYTELVNRMNQNESTLQSILDKLENMSQRNNKNNGRRDGNESSKQSK